MSFGLRSFTTVSFLTFLSRVLGSLRELLLAAAVGAGPLTDAFFLAMRLPNMFRRLFGEGAFSASFIPIFSKEYHHSPKDASKFANHVFTILFLVLIGLVVFFELLMPQIISGIAPGFLKDPAKFHATVIYARIMFPYVAFICLVAFFTAILNTLGYFFAANFAPLLLNFMMIGALIFFNEGSQDSLLTILSWAVSISGLMQIVILQRVSVRVGFSVRMVWPKLSQNVKTLFQKMIPGALGAGVYQVNLFLSDIIASFIPGAISYLAFADRINQLPIGTIGVAMSIVLLPRLSHALTRDSRKEVFALQDKSILFALFLCVPAAVALGVIAEDIIEVIYLRGRFTVEDLYATSATLAAFASGLPAYIIIKVFATIFFAHGDTKTPVRIAIFCMVLNFILNFIFSKFWLYVGIAIATSFTAWINVLAMGYLLQKRQHLAPGHDLKIAAIKIILASTMMGVYLHFMTIYLKDLHLYSFFKVLFLVSSGGGLYLLLSFFLKIVPYQDLKNSFQKKKAI